MKKLIAKAWLFIVTAAVAVFFCVGVVRLFIALGIPASNVMLLVFGAVATWFAVREVKK